MQVILKTTLDEIAVELWSKECPKTCRNFIQLCMEGYYDGTIFHRVIKDFIAQGGDPTGTGQGGESIYGAPFKVQAIFLFDFEVRGLFYEIYSLFKKKRTSFIKDFVSIVEVCLAWQIHRKTTMEVNFFSLWVTRPNSIRSTLCSEK